LLCLHGLLPITYRNASYHIPVAIWLPRDHPRTPPIPYVVPTREMLVRPGRHVDPSGRCSAPYIDHWLRKPEVCLPRQASPSRFLSIVFKPPVHDRDVVFPACWKHSRISSHVSLLSMLVPRSLPIARPRIRLLPPPTGVQRFHRDLVSPLLRLEDSPSLQSHLPHKHLSVRLLRFRSSCQLTPPCAACARSWESEQTSSS
jgi:ESCRT-I complex subunit TSG101